jgi:ribosomal protein S21
MQVNTKKYGGDAMRSYKALMRKLNREGVYQELREKEFFTSKSEKKRKEKIQGTVRADRKHKLRMEHLIKEIPPRKRNSNNTHKQNTSRKQKV